MWRYLLAVILFGKYCSKDLGSSIACRSRRGVLGRSCGCDEGLSRRVGFWLRSSCPAQEREKEKQIAMIKAQYLGAEKQKKKVLKPSEKFRFNFDWEVGTCPRQRSAKGGIFSSRKT